MPLDHKQILGFLQKDFPNAEITLNDLKGDGNHYSLIIVCASFQGKTRVQQHQMVYNSLRGYVGDAIHALSLKTKEKKE